MREIHLERRFKTREEENKRFLKKAPAVEDADVIERAGDVKAFDENGNVLFLVIRGGISRSVANIYYDELVKTKAFSFITFKRATASGQKRINVYKSAVTRFANESAILGFFDRSGGRQNFCRKCAWSKKHPQGHKFIISLAEMVSELYKKLLPEEYEFNKSASETACNYYILGKSCYSTFTINRNFRCFYHRDPGNLEKGMASMFLIRKGLYKGGELIFPNFKAGVELSDRDIIIMNNREIHGNLKFKGFGNFERITTVLYFRRNILFCGTPEKEVERIRKNKIGTGLIRENLNPNLDDEAMKRFFITDKG